jgi:uncharacterized protein YraI
MMPRLVAVIAAIVTLGMASAHAEPAFSTADVNMRAGPDVEFPPVAVIPEGEPVYIKGCLRDESWCDVIWEDDRGWVYSEYLALDYRGELMPLPDVGLVEFRIPIISFAATDYWGRYYVGRPWYRERDRWFSYRIRSRQGWHAPPPGPRRPGWWRSGYHVPSGMRSPPDPGWRRPIHRSPRDLRRNERGEHRGDRGVRRDEHEERGDRYKWSDDRVDRSDRHKWGDERGDRRHNRRSERGDDRGQDTFREDRGDRGPARREDSVSRELQGDGVGRGRHGAYRGGEATGDQRQHGERRGNRGHEGNDGSR